MFFDQLSDFLEHSDNLPGKTLLMGDFNFHFENLENKHSRKLHDIIDMFNLTQSVSEPTHNQDHLLDLVFSKQSDNILISTKLHHRPHIHLVQTWCLCARTKTWNFSYWCLRKIDPGAFKQDLSHAVSQTSSVSDYNNHLCSVLDKHAPLCPCTVRTRKPTPWFSSIAEQLCELKQERRQAERRWLKSKLTVHKQIYDSIKQIVTNLVDKAKQAYYSAKIQSSTTRKQLFQNFNDEFVLKIINSAPAKSCELDPIPTTLLYENLDSLLPTITNIINTSLTTGIVPRDLKTAVFKPLLQKPSPDKTLLKNYRPISNLLFLSKILEKVVRHKLLSHLQENNFNNPFQSAFRAGHSTETVLLRIVNDNFILSALDNDNISVLLLLDLSAAFDTTDHQILLSRLNSVFGIQSTALQWFHRPHRQIWVHFSQITRLRHHHSSCTVCLRAQYWGPFSSSCTLHLSPISQLNHSVNHQLFAYDTQLQKSASLSEVTNLTKELNACTDDIKTWMTEKQLKLNDDKTEARLFPFSSSLKPSTSLIPLLLALKHLLPWFCQEPWIHSWLKTVHEEARQNNVRNCLFRA